MSVLNTIILVYCFWFEYMCVCIRYIAFYVVIWKFGFDVFFPDFEPIIATVSYLIDKNPHCQFWTTYQVRR